MIIPNQSREEGRRDYTRRQWSNQKHSTEKINKTEKEIMIQKTRHDKIKKYDKWGWKLNIIMFEQLA
jgi:hypothetical protein